MASTCRFCNAKCHFCQKLGHVARVCRLRQKADIVKKFTCTKTTKASGSYTIDYVFITRDIKQSTSLLILRIVNALN